MFGTGWCGGMNAWGWLLMALVWGVFLAVVIWAITWMFPRSRSRPPGPPDDAAAVLDRRFASGEIGEDEYRRRLAALQGAWRLTGGRARPSAGAGAR